MKYFYQFPKGGVFLLLIVFFLEGAFQKVHAQPVCSMDIVLQTQDDVNNFNCSEVNGNLTIGAPSADITDLSPLLSLTTISGNLQIISNAILPNLDGLNNLGSIGGTLAIDDNTELREINGLENLTSIGLDVSINVNPLLQHLDGLAQLSHVGDDIIISFNNGLIDINGLIGLEQINGSLRVSSNPNLGDCCGVSFLIEEMNIGAGVTFSGNTGNCNSATDIVNAICCPDFSLALTPFPSLIENTCPDEQGKSSPGSILAPQGNCPVGSNLAYSIDGINFTSNLPSYNRFEQQTIFTRCTCIEDPSVSSSLSKVTTQPTSCYQVPSLSEWGVLILALLLLNLGVIVIQKNSLLLKEI